MRPVNTFAPVWTHDARYLARDRSPFSGGGARNSIRNGTSTARSDSDGNSISDAVVEGSDSSNDENDDSGSGTDEQQQEEEITGAQWTGSRAHAKRASTLKDPFYVAGWDAGKPLPPTPFPHADVDSKPRLRPIVSRDDDELDQSSHGPEKRITLQRQHLAVVTNILHISLLRGDWVRAGRAWGLIISTIHGGRSIDIRNNQRWGIGAEILLRQGAQRTSTLDRDDALPSFSADAFQAAKNYYEQLILQYPYNKHAPDAIASAVDFYPALFGICIYEAVSTSAKAIADLDAADTDWYAPDAMDTDYGGASVQDSAVVAVRQMELAAATAIATRLDSVLAGPPYDQHIRLLQLRGMISLWTADLQDTVVRLQQGRGDRDDDDVTAAIGEGVREAAIERSNARRYLNKAVEVGATLPGVLQDFLYGDT